MTQRNFQNARNTESGKPKGVAKKSASSAKLTSKAASSVYVRSKNSNKGRDTRSTGKSKADKSVEKKASDPAEKVRRRERAMVSMMKDLPEYKHWRRIWWVAMVVAVLGVFTSWIPNALIGNGVLSSDFSETAKVVSGAGFVVAMLALVFAFYIDLGKIRKIQKQQENKARNLTKSERRKLDNAIAASIEKDEKERAERKGKMPWSKKKAATEQADDSEDDDGSS